MNLTPMKLLSSLTSSSDQIKSLIPQPQFSQNTKGSYLFNKIPKAEDQKQSKGIYQSFSRVNDNDVEVNQFKQDLERQYHDRMSQLQQMTQFRLETLWESVQATLKSVNIYKQQKILEDELIETMKQDPTSQEFIWHRIVELFDELFNGEREKMVEKLSEQYALLKSEFNQQQRIIQQLESKIQEFEGQVQVSNSNQFKEIEQSRSEFELLKLQFNEKQNILVQEKLSKFKELNSELLQKKNEMEQQYETNFKQLTKDLEKQSLKNTKLREAKDLQDAKIQQLEEALNEQARSLQQKNFDIQQLNQDNKLALQKIEDINIVKVNDQMFQSKNQDRELNKLVITLQERDIQYGLLLQKNRELEIFSTQQLSQVKEETFSTMNENERLSRELTSQAQLIELKDMEYAKITKINLSLSHQYQENLKLGEETKSQINLLRRQLDEKDVMNESLKDKIQMTEIQYTNQLEQIQRLSKEREQQLRQQIEVLLIDSQKSNQGDLKGGETQISLLKKSSKLNNLKVEQLQNDLLQMKQACSRTEKELQSTKDSECQLQQDIQNQKNQTQDLESQVQELQNLIQQQQQMIQSQKNEYDSENFQEKEKNFQEREKSFIDTQKYQSEILDLQKYCQDLDDQNQQLQSQLYSSKTSVSEAKELKDKVVQKCRDKIKRVVFILNEQKAQCIFELTKMKREVQSLRLFTTGCLSSEKSSIKLILSAFEAQFKGLWSQMQLNFKNQQMGLKNQIADKYEIIVSSMKDQHKQILNEVQQQNEQKVKQQSLQLEEYSQEIQQLINIIEKSESELLQFQEGFQNLESQNVQLEQFLKEKQNEVSALQYQVDLLNQVNKKLESSIKIADKEKLQQKEQNQSLMKQIQTLKEGKDSSINQMKDKMDSHQKRVQQYDEEKDRIQEELQSTKKQLSDKVRQSESYSIRIQEAEKIIIDLEQQVDGLLSNQQKRRPILDNEIKSKDQQIEKLNQIINMQQEEISKIDKENSKVKVMLQRMSDSFEERSVETSKENQDLMKIQSHLQDEIKGLYKVLTHSTVNVKEKEREKENLNIKHHESKDLESKLKQLKDLNSFLDQKSKNKYPSSENLKLTSSPISSYKYLTRIQTQQSPKKQLFYN